MARCAWPVLISDRVTVAGDAVREPVACLPRPAISQGSSKADQRCERGPCRQACGTGCVDRAAVPLRFVDPGVAPGAQWLSSPDRGRPRTPSGSLAELVLPARRPCPRGPQATRRRHNHVTPWPWGLDGPNIDCRRPSRSHAAPLLRRFEPLARPFGGDEPYRACVDSGPFYAASAVERLPPCIVRSRRLGSAFLYT